MAVLSFRNFHHFPEIHQIRIYELFFAIFYLILKEDGKTGSDAYTFFYEKMRKTTALGRHGLHAPLNSRDDARPVSGRCNFDNVFRQPSEKNIVSLLERRSRIRIENFKKKIQGKNLV